MEARIPKKSPAKCCKSTSLHICLVQKMHATSLVPPQDSQLLSGAPLPLREFLHRSCFLVEIRFLDASMMSTRSGLRGYIALFSDEQPSNPGFSPCIVIQMPMMWMISPLYLIGNIPYDNQPFPSPSKSQCHDGRQSTNSHPFTTPQQPLH